MYTQLTKENLMSPIPVRRRPGRPRVPGRLTIDKVTGKMGTYVKECEICRNPILLDRSELATISRTSKRRRNGIVRFFEYIAAYRDINPD